MPNTFYRAFEDRLRGSRELIKARQKVYLPFLQPLKQLYDENLVLDLGCGRGEWLEVLLEDGFQVRGVDLDEGMLEACQALRLPAEQGEAIAMLERIPDASMAVVSGFHIAEHMPFSRLQHLVGEALRTLKPAGLLILETPNPENLVVGTNNFYLDPTHERPIPHLLLNFLTDYSGFTRSKTLRLQESLQLHNETNLELMHVLGGASPDYAIIAQKAAPQEQFALFNEVFAKEYGLALDILAWRYDSGLKSKIREIAEKVDSNTQKDVALYGQLEQLQSKAELLEQRAVNFDENIGLIRSQSQQAAELAAQAQAGAANLELRSVRLEAVADQLRLQLQESAMRLQQAEARNQQAEVSLREWLARASQAEAKHAAAETINESLRQQAQNANTEILASYKVQQQLENHYAALIAQAEQACAEDMRARQLLELALAQAEEQAAALEQELREEKRHAQMLDDECEEAKREFVGASEQAAELKAQLQALNLQLSDLTNELEAVNGHKHQLHSDLLNTEAYKHTLHASMVSLEERLHAIQQQLNESLSSTQHWWQQAVAQEQRVKALLNSTSWRITWPLRTLSKAVGWTVKLPFRLTKAVARSVLHLCMRLALKHPSLRAKLARRLQRHPKLRQHLWLFAKNRNLISNFPPVDTDPAIQARHFSSQQEATKHAGDAPTGPDLSALSVEARRYFNELHNVIEQQKPGSL